MGEYEAKLEERQKAEKLKFRCKIEEKINAFLKDDKSKTLKFPAMDKFQRSVVHDVSEIAGLATHSFGEEDVDRHIQVWLGSTPPPFRGLGNITSSTILSCTVICSRQNPRLYCTVLCRAQYSPVLYSADRNCKATFVFPFRDSTKMPLSRLPREIDIFSCQRRRRESNNQRRTD